MEFVVIFRITCSISNQTHLHGTIIYAIYKKSESPSQPIRVSSVISPHPIPQEWIQPDDPSMETFRKHHRQVRITIFLSMMQLFCGHPNVLNFAPQIFAQIGFDSEKGRLIMTSLVGVVSQYSCTSFTFEAKNSIDIFHPWHRSNSRPLVSQ